jgi:hypothetical protein
MHRSLVALALLALAFPVTARAEDAAVLYDPATVALIDLAIPVESREALAADPGEYVDATFTLEAGELALGPHPVEVRLKGSTSFRPLGGKAAFKVKFPKEHRLLGLKSLTLTTWSRTRRWSTRRLATRSCARPAWPRRTRAMPTCA